MRVLCNKRVELPNTNNIAHTYCMLPINHEGDCDPNPPKDIKIPSHKESQR